MNTFMVTQTSQSMLGKEVSALRRDSVLGPENAHFVVEIKITFIIFWVPTLIERTSTISAITRETNMTESFT